MFATLKAIFKKDTSYLVNRMESMYAEVVEFIHKAESEIKTNEQSVEALFTKTEAIKLEQAAAAKVKATLEVILGKVAPVPATVANPVPATEGVVAPR